MHDSEKAGTEPGNRVLDSLRTAIRDRNIRQAVLVKGCGIHASTVSRFLKPDGDPDQGELTLHQVARVADFIGLNLELVDRSSQVQFYSSRSNPDGSDILMPRLEKARSVIQILTSHPGTKLEEYVAAIRSALVANDYAIEEMKRAGKSAREIELKRLRVTILTAHPRANRFLADRAVQLRESEERYRAQLEASLWYISRAFEGREGYCKLLTYDGLPIQLWHRIDDTLFVSFPSLGRKSRENCLLALPVTMPGVEETFLDHFESLMEQVRPFDPSEEMRPKSGKKKSEARTAGSRASRPRARKKP